MTDAITTFTGSFRWLSNFYPDETDSPYGSLEHRFQATKATSVSEAAWVRSAPTPAEAKRRGRAVRLREDWNQIRDGIMLLYLREKFATGDLRRKLLATGKAHLEEGNDWSDTYWGTVNGRGRNRLGELLMQVRSELQAEEDEWDD